MDVKYYMYTKMFFLSKRNACWKKCGTQGMKLNYFFLHIHELGIIALIIFLTQHASRCFFLPHGCCHLLLKEKRFNIFFGMSHAGTDSSWSDGGPEVWEPLVCPLLLISTASFNPCRQLDVADGPCWLCWQHLCASVHDSQKPLAFSWAWRCHPMSWWSGNAFSHATESLLFNLTTEKPTICSEFM